MQDWFSEIVRWITNSELVGAAVILSFLLVAILPVSRGQINDFCNRIEVTADSRKVSA